MAWGLKSATAASLSTYLREALGPQSVNYTNRASTVDVLVGASTTAAAPTSTGTGAAVFSATTVQEIGVDEADVIKSDGTSVFSLDAPSNNTVSRTVLRRQRLNANAADAAMLPVDSLSIPFSVDVRGSGLYLDADRQQLVAVAEGSGVSGVYDTWFSPTTWSQGVTEVALINASNTTQMQLRRILRISAQLIGSRRVGGTLYLVMRSYPQIPGLDPAWPVAKVSSNQALVDSLTTTQVLPTLAVDGGTAMPLVDAASCYTQDNNAIKSADIVTLMAIDLTAASHSHSARCFTGGTEAFYMSEQSLYLATTHTAYTYSGTTPVYAAQTSTDIHKFSLNGQTISYRGSGNVLGHLGFDQNRKSFRMGEHLGALRVITQTASTWRGWVMPVATTVSTTPSVTTAASVESPAHLSILQESGGNLALVGELPNAARPAPLGKAGEQLYASRFVGSRGYLVTYRLTDPLYVLDLSLPSDPKVVGELQVDGYSDYLFPLTDTLLLGVGKDASSDGSAGDGRFAWYQGVKLSVIDLTDPANPKEAARRIIGRRGTDATVLHDHHGIALQIVGNKVRIGLPVSLYDTAPSSSTSSTGAASDYFQFTRTELQKFEIDVSAKTITTGIALSSGQSGWRDISADRALLWNNQVHYYQNGNWRSGGW